MPDADSPLAAAVSSVIRERFEAMNISGRELAQRCGLPQATVFRYVSGRTLPGVIELSTLARELRTTGGAILGEAERRAEQQSLARD